MLLLKKLTDACGLPGFEDEVREIIKDEIKDYVDSIKVDRMGNLIVTKNSNASGPHIALSAHMDEVGLCVRHINADGSLRFASWGADQRLLPSMHVRVGDKKIPGVIGTKPIHLQTEADRGSVIDISNMVIDIGCDKKEEAEKLVSLGDFVAFSSEFTEFGDSSIKAKALDDRVGCATIIEILKMDLPCKLTGIFCTQEEVGLRGSAVAAKSLKVDLVINLEGTIGADMEGIPEHEHVTTQGAGPSISLMDRTSIYKKEIVESIVKVAEKHNIPYQYRRTGMGGTDAANYHKSDGGTPVIGLAVPCRYIHSPVSVMNRNDYENLIKLVATYINERCKK